MTDADRLWYQISAAVEGHRNPPRDRHAQATLDRIAAKCIRMSFNPDNCDVHEAVLPFDELNRLTRFAEDDAEPSMGYEDTEPIVVLLYAGQWLVIDGRRRVTKWMNEGGDKLRHALIITPRET